MPFIDQLITELKGTGLLEYLAVFAGIASVLLSRAENIWLYPIGLINTIIYIYLSFTGHLLGEASVNLFYTIVSIYGWWLWARKDQEHKKIVHITFSTKKEWLINTLLTALLYGVIYLLLCYAKKAFAPGAIPWADAFASATAYMGMWLMARKKVESWVWWIATDLASIPLYYAKGYAFTSVQFLVFTVLAVMGLMSWWKKGLNLDSHD